MKDKNTKLQIISFYSFVKIKHTNIIKIFLEDLLRIKKIRGTILISYEGINGSIAGKNKDLNEIIKQLKLKLKIRKLEIKTNNIDSLPFNRMKVRLKKEIISLGRGKINVSKFKGNYIEPSEWDNILNNKNINVIDTRNIFEHEIGKFENAINPMTESFREFPKKFKELNIDKNEAIALYCTGGIRCEKASAYLSIKGYKNISQLRGGILNYLQYKQNSKQKLSWVGECFVFDSRVAVNANLTKGQYDQCFGCRHPIVEKDKYSEYFKKGVYCPKCYLSRTSKQIKKSESREKQIRLNQIRNNVDSFKVIKIEDFN
tara:strand:+ start:25 stop:972 length:948 start_codon:yes stop_codon:yes gene_type:complete